MMNRKQRRATLATSGWLPMERAALVPLSDAEIERRAHEAINLQPGLTLAEARRMIADAKSEITSTWRNHLYQAHLIRWPSMRINGRDVPIMQLSIRRLDRGAARDWRDFQRIKNQLVGPEYEAVELYPAESRLVDGANQFHLWCVMDESFRFPFGYNAGRAVTNGSIGGSVNRPVPAGE